MTVGDLIARLKSECDSEADEVHLVSSGSDWEILSIYRAPEDGFLWIDIEGSSFELPDD